NFGSVLRRLGLQAMERPKPEVIAILNPPADARSSRRSCDLAYKKNWKSTFFGTRFTERTNVLRSYRQRAWYG
ncbi:MAG: hypothetical protein ACPG4X_20460, partial [Pikeienuella sp.]